MNVTKDERIFRTISALYSVIWILFSLTTYLFYDLVDGKTSWMIFFIGTFFLTAIYYQVLQIKIKKIESSITALAGAFIMGGFAIGIVTLLIIQPEFKPFMWTIFSIPYVAGTIWAAKKLWID